MHLVSEKPAVVLSYTCRQLIRVTVLAVGGVGLKNEIAKFGLGRNRSRDFWWGLVVVLIVTRGAFAQTLTVDPVSPAIQTDRPSFSAGAALVPVRSLQLEAGAKYTSSAGERKTEWGQVLLRYGLGSKTELRLGLNSYTVNEQVNAQQKGLEDFVVSAKFKLLGEAAGARPAVSLLPGLSIPSGHSSVSNDDWLPSLSLLLDWALGGSFSLSSNLGWSRAISDDEEFDKFSASLLLAVQLTDRLSGYAEGYIFDREVPGGATASYADTGMIYQITNTLTVDATLGAGLNGTETDYYFGAGLGKRW